MGRAPCCDKANVKRGPWSPEEDSKLKSYIQEHGTGGNWIALPQKIGLKRCGKSCRLRWLNYLRPNIKHGGFSEEEDNIICNLYISIGSRWSIIAAQLPGRTDNDIKNYWNTRLKKKLLGKQRKDQQSRRSIINSVLKQDMIKKEIRAGNFMSTSNSTIVDNGTQNLYFPEQPQGTNSSSTPLHTNQNGNPSHNYHNSIRKLLIKLGGRFSSTANQNQLVMSGDCIAKNLGNPSEVSSTHEEQVYDDHEDYPMENWFSSTSYHDSMNYSMMNNNTSCTELLNNMDIQKNQQYDHILDDGTISTMQILQQAGLNCFPDDEFENDEFIRVDNEEGSVSNVRNNQSSSSWVDNQMSSFEFNPSTHINTNNYGYDFEEPNHKNLTES